MSLARVVCKSNEILESRASESSRSNFRKNGRVLDAIIPAATEGWRGHTSGIKRVAVATRAPLPVRVTVNAGNSAAAS